MSYTTSTVLHLREIHMAKTVHARLDQQSHALLRRLRLRTGLTESEVLRRGLRLLAAQDPQESRRRIIGLGKFVSGCPDLGSNERHLRGFGRA